MSDDRIKIEVDLERFRVAFESVAAGVRNVVETIAATVVPALVRAAEALRELLGPLTADRAQVERYAIEVLGLTEVDIKSADGFEVRTWNRRRYPIEWPAFCAWAFGERTS